MTNEEKAVEDYRLCNSEGCEKTHCARHFKNRIIYGKASDLLQTTIAGRCDNYTPKAGLTPAGKRNFKIIK